MTDIIDTLARALGEDALLTGAAVRARTCGYWDSSPLRAKAIARPRSTAEVSTLLRLCNAVKQPVVMHGGLTGCAEGHRSGDDDIVLSLERMTAIEEVDPVGSVAVVQAGVVLESLHRALAEHDLTFPVDLGARGSCTIGGNIATNAGGVTVLRYGMTRDLILGLEVVLADGRILSSMNRMLKNNAGFDLKQMFIGSEGTLGVITRAVLKLVPCAIGYQSALVAVDRFDHVVSLLTRARRCAAAPLTSFELMWGDYYRVVTGPGQLRQPLRRDHRFYVLLDCESVTDAPLAALLERALDDDVVADAVLARSQAQRDDFWRIRENFEPILAHEPSFLYDVSLPLKDMEVYIDQVAEKVCDSFGPDHLYVFGHVADGNLHLFVQAEAGRDRDGDLKQAADRAVYEPLRQFGGSVSAEHGIGHQKKAWLSLTRTPEEIAMMHRLKAMLDPEAILNPGVIINSTYSNAH